MIYKLGPTDYWKIRPLFKPMAKVLTFCRAALEGVQEGQVFVDNLAHPTAALMITWDVWGYLAGDPYNDIHSLPSPQMLVHHEGIDVAQSLVVEGLGKGSDDRESHSFP